MKSVVILLALASLLSCFGRIEAATGSKGRVLAVVQEMEAAFKTMEDYTCEVDQVFYEDGAENQRYRFKFYFKKEKKIRVDFFEPHNGLTIFYSDEDREATVAPLRFLPLRIRLSVDNPLMRTLAGQRINQTDMGYFINFLLKNLDRVEQKEDQLHEDEEQVKFLFWALDYIKGKSLEKYRVSVSKKVWLPTRIERYSLEDKLLEVTDIKNYVLNAHLEDRLLLP
jgi:outer membrane lipoprotein-sorting protein